MATPTNPMKNVPSQQGYGQGRTPSGIPTATPPVSTPFSTSHAHAAFSPQGPKSSPQQFKKSPANSATLMGHHGSAPLNFDSPSAAAAMGALGIGGGLDIGLDNVGVGTLAGLGGLAAEDERVKRLDTIIRVLGDVKGRVSEAGLERLSQRTGLNKMWEDHRLPGGRFSRTLVMAGHGLQLDINLENNIVQSVTLAFPESESAPIVAKHADRAGRILLKDLQLTSKQSPLTKTLDSFAANLEHLAHLDKLSVFPGLDCQEAVAGVFESLERLYKWELSKVREESAPNDKSERLIESTVLCTRSGRPGMHVRDHVGMSLDYWVERRFVPPTTPESEQYTEQTEKTWGLLIGCRALEDGELYHAVRVSQDWISTRVEKEEPGPEDLLQASGGPVLEWLEPDPTILPPNSDHKDVGVDIVQPDGTTQKFPNVKFVATFEPSLIVPQSVFNSLYGLVGAQPAPMLLPGNTFDGLFFPIPEGSAHDAGEPRVIHSKTNVLVRDSDGDMLSVEHANTLFIYKPVYGQIVTELPFAHPQQLVHMLPILRQYSFISTLLARSFGETWSLKSNQVPEQTTGGNTAENDFDVFMSAKQDSKVAGAGKALGIDVVLTVHPTAGLSVVFPFRGATANIDLLVQPGGTVQIASQNIIPERDEGGITVPTEEQEGSHDTSRSRNMKPQDLGRLLEIFEDLCQWAEWIRMNLS